MKTTLSYLKLIRYVLFIRWHKFPSPLKGVRAVPGESRPQVTTVRTWRVLHKSRIFESRHFQCKYRLGYCLVNKTVMKDFWHNVRETCINLPGLDSKKYCTTIKLLWVVLVQKSFSLALIIDTDLSCKIFLHLNKHQIVLKSTTLDTRVQL